MSEILFLVKYGEIALKKRNRGAFIKRLKDSIHERLPDLRFEVTDTFQRVFVRCSGKDRDAVATALARTFGIVSFCETVRVPADIASVEAAAEGLARSYVDAGKGSRFKAEVRRAEKSFPLTSYEIACRVGDLLLSRFPGLKVDVHEPDWVITIEMRECAYLYGPSTRGPYGLPGGSSGRGLLLLSGGIDSPVAGWMMGKRGMALEAVYFHSAPFTSEQAREKVEDLVRTLRAWIPTLRLHVVHFTPVLARIKERAKDEEVTLLLRACMMRFSTLMAPRIGALSLITGESLGQVASQTVESMAFTGSYAGPPVFRPLVGMNKEEIIAVAERIDTFEISNRPFADCCTLFAPEHPLVHPDMTKMTHAYERLEIEPLLVAALEETLPGSVRSAR